MIITAILGALVLVGGGVTAVILVKGDHEPAAAMEQAPGPADTSVIGQKVGEVTKYGDVAVFDACTVLPVSAVEELGFKDAAHGWHNQTYLSRSVPTAEATIKDELDPISVCMYEPMIENRMERITVSIYQRPFNSLLPADRAIKDDTLLTVGGLRTAMSPGLKPDSFDARITTNDGKTQAIVGASTMSDVKDITDHKAAFMKLLELVAQNLSRGPQGLTTHVHTGRYEKVPSACDILSAELFQELTQSKDSGIAEANFREREGMKKFVNDKNETHYYYSNQQDCRRLSPEWYNAKSRSDGKALMVELETYRDAEMAVRNAHDCDPNSPSRKVFGEAVLTNEKIGDFATCSYRVGDSPTMSFVAGRTQVRLTGFGNWAPDDPKQYNEVFTPVAKRMVDEVRKAIG
ncbi:hypothetical protein UK23_38825 [Lentzea aerocolonigenes]|uniref:Uncharacterized protein n=1 Tax=Lentzea aerocolonigenes TaxID=68170 RepID=A0A0F0GFD3_LENAE|nr:hypothetical protein UK23_38825 [Lentzea aerocolonigenes]